MTYLVHNIILLRYTVIMPQVNCSVCSKEFHAKPSWLKNGYGKYCSQKCSHIRQRNGREYSCHTCRKIIYRTKKDQRVSKSGKFFCTKKCQTLWRNSEVYVGSNHPNWTNGESTYRVRLLRSGRKKNCERCLTKDTRIIAVHHRDKNRSNNKLTYLIWLCQNFHFLIHNYSEETKSYITT